MVEFVGGLSKVSHPCAKESAAVSLHAVGIWSHRAVHFLAVQVAHACICSNYDLRNGIKGPLQLRCRQLRQLIVICI